MAYFKRVVNVNPLIEEKMNYFLNRFQHMVENSGDEAQFEVETPLSILQKIHFLFTNETDSDFQIKYLDVFFQDPVFKDSQLLGTFENYIQVKSVVSQYPQKSAQESNQALRARKTALVSDTSFQKSVIALIAELKVKLPQVLHTQLISVLGCRSPLADHNHTDQLSELARLYVSAAYYSAKSSKEIQDIVGRIFDKEKDRFPFPKEIRTPSAKKKLLTDSTLDTQVRAFQQLLYDNRKFGKVVMKLYGGWLPTDFEFRYMDVLFMGRDHKNIEKLKLSDSQEGFTSFFAADDEATSGFIYVCTEVKSFTHSSVRMSMVELCADAIKFLGAILRRDFCLDTSDNYAIANRRWRYLGGHWSSLKYDTPISGFEIEKLKENAFKILERHRSRDTVRWFLSKEHLHTEARKSGSAADYWKYLEALTKHPNNNQKVEHALPYILLLNTIPSQKRRVLKTLAHGTDFLSGGDAVFDLPFQDLVVMHNSLRKGIVNEAVRKTESVFIQELVAEFEKEGDIAFLKSNKDYYVRAITESYGLRNFLVHRGVNSPYSQIKTQHTLPYMVTRFRWLLYEELKSSRHDNFGDLVEFLLAKGKAMLTQ